MEKVDLAFISPPWGGIDYAYGHFDLDTNIPLGMSRWLEQCFRLSDPVGVFLPRNT